MGLTTLFVDLNAYFASVTQQLRPELRGRPVAIVPVMTDSTCCLTASYEAKARGVTTGTNVAEVRRRCPGITFVESQVREYVAFHHAILAAAETCLPIQAVYSIDEFSCPLLGRDREPDRAVQLARAIKKAILERVGECMRCSIGIAPNRFLAKVASDMQKPDGLVLIRSEDLPRILYPLKLTDLPGIGRRMFLRLQARGIRTIEALCKLDQHEMTALWGSIVGGVFWAWLRGEETPESATTRRSLGHQHVLPPQQRHEAAARSVAILLLHRAAARMRRKGYWARRLILALQLGRHHGWADKMAFPECRDTLTLIEMLTALWARRPRGDVLCVSVTLADLVSSPYATLPLFPDAARRDRLAAAMDRINTIFGPYCVYTAAMHEARGSAPTRISYASIPEDEWL